MTEREIILLGLKSELVKEHEDDETYYYVLDIVDGLTFITPTNEEIREDNWYIEFFNTDPSIRIYSFGEAQGLLNQLTRNIYREHLG
jgi:hypothetical protein